MIPGHAGLLFSRYKRERERERERILSAGFWWVGWRCLMQTHRFSKPSDIFLSRASLSEGFSRKIAAKILWVMAAHKVGCGLRLPSAVPNRPPLPSKTTPWPESRAFHRHFLRWILGDTSTGERQSRFLISRIIFSYPSPVGYRLRFENGERFLDPGETSVPVSPIFELLSSLFFKLKLKRSRYSKYREKLK